jgi:4-amino-4-deoxy-L-arabinose transferase-like glycosyltransferase
LSFAPAARSWRAIAIGIIIAAALAIISTHFTFSNTYDEPAHIAAGVEWLSGNRAFDAQRPPLGRIAAGLGPYLRGERPSVAASPIEEGARLLGRGDHYRTTLALGRLGELPFFILLCAVAWTWGRRLTDERGGAIAVLLTAANPNVLAHAGLATTDIAFAATLSMALLAFVFWLDEPHWARAIVLGLAVALAATSDFASLPMLTLALPAMYWLRRRQSDGPVWPTAPRWKKHVAVGVTLVVAAAAGWALYGFATGPLIDGSHLIVPAPAWFRGLLGYVGDASAARRPAFLFGERAVGGWWYYYPVALLVKTPLPLLLLSILGAAAGVRELVRRDHVALVEPLVAAIAIVAAATIDRDDAGVRLVLPVFAMLALLSTVAVRELWETTAKTAPARRLLRATVAATLAAALVVPIRAHPDHLAYFNPIAGDHPELILVDSNLDWGQDLYRLNTVMKRLRIESIALAYYGSAGFDAAGVRNARLLVAAERPTGWIAASQTMLAGVGGDGAYEWLNELQPVGRVGSSLVLYYVPPRPRTR